MERDREWLRQRCFVKSEKGHLLWVGRYGLMQFHEPDMKDKKTREGILTGTNENVWRCQVALDGDWNDCFTDTYGIRPFDAIDEALREWNDAIAVRRGLRFKELLPMQDRTFPYEWLDEIRQSVSGLVDLLKDPGMICGDRKSALAMSAKGIANDLDKIKCTLLTIAPRVTF